MRDAEASTTPAHAAQNAPRAETPLQAPNPGPAAEAATDGDEARKRARRIERFAPPTPYEIAMAAATATAARMAAGRAHDWSARDPPADELSVANHTRGVASAGPSTRRKQIGRAALRPEPAAVPNGSNTPEAAATDVAKGACDTAASAIAAPTTGMPQHCANRAISMPVPAGEPEATRVPEAGSAAATEERVANGTRALAAPTPGTLDRQAIRATSLPAPAAKPGATTVPEGGSPTVAAKGVASRMRTIGAPSLGDQTGRADKAARISRATPVAVPDGSSKRVANGTRALAAPTPGTLDRQAIRATSLPAPAAKPGATTVPEGGSPTVAEEGVAGGLRASVAPSPGDPTGCADTAARISRATPVAVPDGSSKRVANGTRALAAPTPGTLDRQAIRATSLPAPAAKPGATTVPEGGSPTVAEEGVTGGLRASVAPSPGDPTGCADTAAPTLMTSPATDPDGSSAPTVTTGWLSVATRDAAILLIPVAHHPSVGATCCGGRRASQLVLSCSGLSTKGSVRSELDEKSGSPFTGNGSSIR